MKNNPCIIILSYPNTDEKLNILMKSLNGVKTYNVPVYVFSNMDIDKKYLEHSKEFIYTGENKLFSASEFLSIKDITLARKITKYRHHLSFSDNIITYLPITYGTEKSYYWALTKLYKKSFEHVYNQGHTHFMLLQYDTILNDKTFNLFDNYLNELYSSELDGIISVDPNMGNNHMNDYAFFGSVKWWNELFSSTSAEEFYTMTYPNWTIEEYYYLKCKNKEGKIKIKVRTNLEEWEKDYYYNIPSNWIREDINCLTRDSVNLFFPDITDAGLSNYWDTPYFDIEKSLTVSILKLDDFHQIFVQNKSISEHDKKISVNISFPNENDSDINISPINLELSPSMWHIKNYHEPIEGRMVNVEYSYLENGKLINNTKTYYV
jgi:hypothetical protein